MAKSGKADTGPSLESVAKSSEETAKTLMATGVSLKKLMEEVVNLQNSAVANHNKAAENVRMIEENKKNIAEINTKTNVMEIRQECQSKSINTCMERLEVLEKNQMLFRRVQDQDTKISQLYKKISPDEMVKASCVITLHGLHLPKKISEMNLSDNNDVNIIANSLVDGLQKQTAEFIFAAGDEGFSNMAAWARCPENDNFRYSAKTPESARNSLIFYFKNRIQAIHFESKIRGALIATQSKRKDDVFASLEMGTYADSARVRALKGLLLYKGKLLVEGFPQLAQYRVVFRGGANRTSQEPANLTLEVKASKEFLEGEKRDFFFNDQGILVRNVWTDQCNIKLSDMDQTWFSRKPEVNQKMEARVVAVKATPIEKKPKRNRDSPGTAGNQAKQQCEFTCPHPGCDKSFRSKPGLNEHKKESHGSVHTLSSDDEEGEDEVAAEVNQDQKKNEGPEVVKEVSKENEVKENTTEKKDSNDTDFSPPNSKKDKKAAKNRERLGARNNSQSSRLKPPTPFALHAPVPDLQRKITTFATVTKAAPPDGSSIPNALPVPVLFS